MKALLSDREYQDHYFPIWKANYAILVLALVAAGYASDEFKALEPECGTNLVERECRKAKWVQMYLNALSAGVDLATLPDVKDCTPISAANAALAGTYASLTVNPAGANNAILFTSKTIGAIGNLIQVQYVDPAANNQALAITQVGPLVRISLATGAGGAITTTASQIVTAMASHPLLTAALVAGETGATAVTAMAAANLSGGTN